MHPTSHFLTGWLVANSSELNQRERAIVTFASVIPDIDSLGIIAEVATRGSTKPLLWWSEYHHVLGHNLMFGIAYALFGFTIAAKRWRTALLSFLSFHMHLLGDVVGARGPDGDQWPIPYLFPFSDTWKMTWEGQWALNSLPNVLITCIALALTFYLAWKQGYSPLEIFSAKADKAFVKTLRDRFQRPNA